MDPYRGFEDVSDSDGDDQDVITVIVVLKAIDDDGDYDLPKAVVPLSFVECKCALF